MQLLRTLFGSKPRTPPALPEHDLSQLFRIQSPCAGCEQPFHVPWFGVLDVEHRRDELERATAVEPATAKCPACGFLQPASLPILLVIRSKSPHLFLVCADRLSTDNGRITHMLAGCLHESGGEAVSNWLDEPLQSVERPFLYYLIESFDEPAEGEWVTPLQWQVLQYVQIAGRGHAAEEEVINRYSEICWAPARDMLEAMLRRADERGDEVAAARFRLANQMLDMIRIANGINIDP